MLAHFRPISNKQGRLKLNTKRDKLIFSFRMYDLDGDGQISKVSIVNYDLVVNLDASHYDAGRVAGGADHDGGGLGQEGAEQDCGEIHRRN